MGPDSESLRPKLEAAQDTLRTALDHACNADLEDADTGELIRLEEVLAIANEAAKEAVSVRRRMSQTRGRSSEVPDEPTHREFEDAKSVRWIAFAVHPSATTGGGAGFRAQYQHGWLAFDCGTETRRLAPIPDGWLEKSDDELRALCEHAEQSRRTKPRES